MGDPELPFACWGDPAIAVPPLLNQLQVPVGHLQAPAAARTISWVTKCCMTT